MDAPSSATPQVETAQVRGKKISIPLRNCTRRMRITVHGAVQLRLKGRAEVELVEPREGSNVAHLVCTMNARGSSSNATSEVNALKSTACQVARQSLAEAISAPAHTPQATHPAGQRDRKGHGRDHGRHSPKRRSGSVR